MNRPHSYKAPASLDRLGTLGLGVGVLGAVALAVGYFTAHDQFFRSYLVGWVLWTGVALGSLAFAMINHLTGGGWGIAARRIFEASSRTLPLLAVLFVPIALGIHSLYHWSHADAVAKDPLLQHKAAYLNSPGFLIRTAIFFLIWIVISHLLSKWSAAQDDAPSLDLIAKMKKVSAAGLLLLGITATLASVDWVMSTDPHYYSSIYGIWLLGGFGLSAMAFTILIVRQLADREPMDHVFTKVHFHDYGKLLFAFTMLWTYFSLSQFLITWSGNIPEEAIWYQNRITGGWQYVGIGLAVFHWAFPFLLLLSRERKRNVHRLALVAGWLLIMRAVDLYWHIAPNYSKGVFKLHWLDVAAPLAIGGLFLAFFVRELKKRSLVPVNDPYLEEALAHGGH